MENPSFDRLVEFYLDPVEVYYTHKNIPRGKVLEEIRERLDKYGKMTIKIKEGTEIISVNSPDLAELSFEMSYNYSVPEGPSGKVIRRFWLKRIGDRWRIQKEV
jgi:hypothetical protein